MKKLKVTVDGRSYEVEIEALESADAAGSNPTQPTATQAPADGEAVLSPLAGKVVEIKVDMGATVGEGDTLLVLEAMKMNTLVSSTASGSITAIPVSAGDIVEEGQTLVTIG